jgi:SAM-dependent methyltransferase
MIMNNKIPVPQASKLRLFDIHPHNSHYDGAYTEKALEWRRLGASDKVDNLASLLGGRPVQSVMEVGCGTGAVLAEVKRRGIGVEHVGIDMSDPNDHRDALAVGLNLQEYDGSKIPWPDKSFDLVFASHVVEHVPNPRAFLEELHRVARCWIYIEVPCEMHLRANQKSIQQALRIGHINAYTPDYFLLLLQTAGLEIEAFDVFDHSEAVSLFSGKSFKKHLIMSLRKAALRMNASLAAKMFCYHAGALCRV